MAPRHRVQRARHCRGQLLRGAADGGKGPREPHGGVRSTGAPKESLPSGEEEVGVGGAPIPLVQSSSE